MSDKDAMDLLAELHEKCQNLLASGSLPLPDKLHAEGMRGGIEDMAEMTKPAWDAVACGDDDE